MKRLIVLAVVLVSVAAVLPAQVTFDEFQAAFQQFADAAVGSLASTATSGLAWSPAYIGPFPHLGLGLTVGAAMMPYQAVSPVLEMLSIALPPELAFLQTLGVPLPAAAIDARIGGFLLPFDVGLKIGFIPDAVKAVMGGVQADYFIAGGDLRIAVLQDEGVMPALSIGAGYSYLKGGVHVAGLLKGAQPINIDYLMYNYGGKSTGTYELEMTDPALNFTWESHVIEAKVQLSKNLLIFTPHVGLSAAYALSSLVGGGLSADITYLVDSVAQPPASFSEVQAAFVAAGQPEPSATQGFAVAAVAPAGWAFRIYGGSSVNLAFLRLDLGATWNVLTGSWGGNLNLRFEM